MKKFSFTLASLLLAFGMSFNAFSAAYEMEASQVGQKPTKNCERVSNQAGPKSVDGDTVGQQESKTTDG